MRWGDAISSGWTDRAAEREGSDLAQMLQTPDDLLAWIADHPEHASFYSEASALHADTLRPTIGASFVAASHAARQHVQAGRLDTSARVAPGFLDRVALAATHTPESVSISTLIARTRSGDAAAHDALLSLLDMRELPSHAPPLPAPQSQTGLRLAWRNHTFAYPTDTLAVAYGAMSADQVAAQIATMQSGWLHDADFRAAEQVWRAGQPPLSARSHRALASATLPRTSVRALASSLAPGDTLWFSEPGFVLATAFCSEAPSVVALSDLPLGLWRSLDASRLPMDLARKDCSHR